METRPYNDKSVIYNLADTGVPEGDENVILCMPRFGWKVARNFLREQGFWRSSYSMQYLAGEYLLPDQSEMDAIEAIISETLGACEMSCNELLDVMLRIAEANEASAACCGSGSGSNGAGGVDDVANTYVDNGTNFPPDFDDRAEYLAAKCLRSNTFVSGAQADIDWMIDVDLIGISVALVTGALLTPIPGDEVLALFGAIALLLAEATADAVMSEIKAWLVSEEDELVCILFESASAAIATNSLVVKATNDLSASAKIVFAFFVSFASLNSVFEDTPPLDFLPNTVDHDCGLCEAQDSYIWRFDPADVGDWDVTDAEWWQTQGNGDSYSIHTRAFWPDAVVEFHIDQAQLEARFGGSISLSDLIVSVEMFSGTFEPLKRTHKLKLVGTGGYTEERTNIGINGVWTGYSIVVPPEETGVLTGITCEMVVSEATTVGTLWDNLLVQAEII